MTNEQAFLEGMREHRAGRRAEAESLYRRVLAERPGHADAMHLLGVLAHEMGRDEEAMLLMQGAIAADPTKAHYYRGLGAMLADQGRLAEAIEQYRKALALRPHYPEALYNLGNALLASRDLEGAIEAYRGAIGLREDFPEAENNLGVALEESERLDESVEVFRGLLARRPDFPGAQNNYGNALRDLGLLDEAIGAYRQAMAQCDDPRPANRLLLTVWYHPDYDRRRIYDEHVRWEQRYAAPLGAAITPHGNERSPGRRLRIGYVSPDFRNHSCSFYLSPLLSHHDHESFEIFCYSDVRTADAMTGKLRTYADRWRDIIGMSDERVAGLVREDGIDILVDLTMHMAYNRLLVFARKPAPVQATWLGYPGTTGLKTIDYRISDRYVDPPSTSSVPAPGVNDEYYSERTIRLPDCYWCYDPLADESEFEISDLRSEITFGCLNHFSKVNDVTLAMWGTLLERVRPSRLLLRAPRGSARQRVVARAAERGIDSGRIDFVDRQPRQDYLAAHRRLHLCLDTFPYNGHTTMLDALWMGVPTVTLAGETAVSRGGLSILSNVGLGELVANNSEEYVRLAAELASDPPRLTRLRSGLRERMQSSPLMDAPRFARGIEAAFRQMWTRWCADGNANRVP